MGDSIRRQYNCAICGKQHDIVLPLNISRDKGTFPFAHVFLHKMERDGDIEEKDIDILTTLYIDADLAIRHVEVKKLVKSDIISKNDSKNIISRLMEEIARLQEENARLVRALKTATKG